MEERDQRTDTIFTLFVHFMHIMKTEKYKATRATAAVRRTHFFYHTSPIIIHDTEPRDHMGITPDSYFEVPDSVYPASDVS
jgi:hypothetical protein